MSIQEKCGCIHVTDAEECRYDYLLAEDSVLRQQLSQLQASTERLQRELEEAKAHLDLYAERDAVQLDKINSLTAQVSSLREQMQAAMALLEDVQVVSGDAIHRTNPESRQVVNSSAAWVVGTSNRSEAQIRRAVHRWKAALEGKSDAKGAK